MNEQEVVTLRESSTTEHEWNMNCDKVKKACGGGYPGFWFAAIVRSGLANRKASTFNREEV